MKQGADQHSDMQKDCSKSAGHGKNQTDADFGLYHCAKARVNAVTSTAAGHPDTGAGGGSQASTKQATKKMQIQKCRCGRMSRRAKTGPRAWRTRAAQLIYASI